MAPLPTKENFIQKKVDPVSCGICREEFDKEHTPVQLETCKHVFGHHCILNWFESDRAAANTCPNCRTVLFLSEDATVQGDGNGPYDNSDGDDGDTRWNNDDQYQGYDYDLDYQEDNHDDGDIESFGLAGPAITEAEREDGEDDSGSGTQENEPGDKDDDELEEENLTWLVESGGFGDVQTEIKVNDGGSRATINRNPSWDWSSLSQETENNTP